MSSTNDDSCKKIELKKGMNADAEELNIKITVKNDIKALCCLKKEEENRKAEPVKKNKRNVRFAVSPKIEYYNKEKKWYESSSENDTSDEEDWSRY